MVCGAAVSSRAKFVQPAAGAVRVNSRVVGSSPSTHPLLVYVCLQNDRSGPRVDPLAPLLPGELAVNMRLRGAHALVLQHHLEPAELRKFTCGSTRAPRSKPFATIETQR